MTPRRLLIVAGSDPLGYSGLLADVRNCTLLGVDSLAITTALTEQSRFALFEPGWVDPSRFARALELVLEDGPLDAVKVGLVGDIGVVDALLRRLPPSVPIVLDPVFATGSGQTFVPFEFVSALAERLERFTLVTPNGPELAALAGRTVRTPSDAQSAAEALVGRGASAVLAKGGHLEGPLVDRLVTVHGSREFPGDRVDGGPVRGTGCALATVIAGAMALGRSLEAAVEIGLPLVRDGIRRAALLGSSRLRLDAERCASVAASTQR